jgi:hypothetical protein
VATDRTERTFSTASIWSPKKRGGAKDRKIHRIQLEISYSARTKAFSDGTYQTKSAEVGFEFFAIEQLSPRDEIVNSKLSPAR